MPLFAGFNRREIEALGRLMDEIDVKEGRVLTREGASGREFFIVVSGSVRVERNGRKVNEPGPGDFLGDPALWDRAEGLIRDALDEAGIEYRLKPKDGTFYAPKIDLYVDDALGREWQMATIQVDLTMLPERFDLSYIDEHGSPQRPIAIHRAIYGTLERFIGILTEHFAGAFPFWLAPVQATIIPIADRHLPAAGELAAELAARGLRVEVDRSDNRMQNKIRLAQEQKVPLMLVLGDREVEARTVAVRHRDGRQEPGVGWDELGTRLAEQVRTRTVG